MRGRKLPFLSTKEAQMSETNLKNYLINKRVELYERKEYIETLIKTSNQEIEKEELNLELNLVNAELNIIKSVIAICNQRNRF